MCSYTVVFVCGTATRAIAATTTQAVSDASTTEDTSDSTCRPGSFFVSIVANKTRGTFSRARTSVKPSTIPLITTTPKCRSPVAVEAHWTGVPTTTTTTTAKSSSSSSSSSSSQTSPVGLDSHAIA